MRAVSLLRFNELVASRRPVDSLAGLNELQQTQAYPRTADWMRRASAGYGRWDGAYLCDDLSTQLTAQFGGINLSTIVGAPLFNRTGILGPLDRSIQVSSGNRVDGPTTAFDADGTEDVLSVTVVPAVPSGGTFLFYAMKGAANGTGALWRIGNNASLVRMTVSDGTNSSVTPSVAAPTTEPYLILAGASRATNQSRIGVIGLHTRTQTLSALTSIASVGSLTNAETFKVGHTDLATGPRISFFAAGVNVNAAAGVPENMSTIIASLADAIMSVPSVVDSAAGRGRSFVALSGHGFEAADQVAGTTLLTRDASVQAIVQWDIASQGAAMLWSLAKTGGASGSFDAGASSVQTIAGNGYVETTVDSANGGRFIGLSTTDTNVNYTSIHYCIYLNAANSTVVYESGSNRGTFGTSAVGDVLTVRRTGTTITYERNGVVFYTSGVASSGALLVDTTFEDVGGGLVSSLSAIRLVGVSVPIPITWQNITNVTPTASLNLGTLYTRGKATSSAEYLSAGVELRVTNAALGIGEIRWLWQDTAGVLKRQAGGHFQAPATGYVMLTATRRWESATKVVLRYYLANQLLAEIDSVDGDIGGTASGTTTIGTRFDGTNYTDFFDGVIDELQVLDYELSPEEIANTWERLTQGSKYVRMMRALLPQGRIWRAR